MSADAQEEALVNQIQEEMRSMRNHFIVVTLTEQKKGQKPGVIVDPVPLMSNEFVDTRSAFLEKCQMCVPPRSPPAPAAPLLPLTACRGPAPTPPSPTLLSF